MKYKKFKLNPGCETQWRSWCDFLRTQKTLVFETMREEKVWHESCWLTDGYVYYGMEGECLPATDRDINKEHKKNRKECLELPGTLVDSVPKNAEILFDFRIEN